MRFKLEALHSARLRIKSTGITKKTKPTGAEIPVSKSLAKSINRHQKSSRISDKFHKKDVSRKSDDAVRARNKRLANIDDVRHKEFKKIRNELPIAIKAKSVKLRKSDEKGTVKKRGELARMTGKITGRDPFHTYDIKMKSDKPKPKLP